ncbi:MULTISPECIES: NAD-dependent epimerase/dehydratase family protein [unclassified Rhizobium]|uniref:NAD-dependent epimerase/dehydratase family protein n=1 Tax=unclassified Rhizobium TaxID=2613769 RepID=UPI001ADBFA52|nr:MULTISPECIES: NAD(P)-dependent oxidoreductase [unclassified Rhizobium]MBO9099363.1 NAD(P)-dependent oxidoreductase [Rhizobium sp. L58/93]MBO9131831.1 NAD(P)-dependent oxidoreductase [Rhizobium sp. B209b/85]MBO9169627.1 NAD(P)-dependent oxidoreductase [Rhizobium sp. L245/93]MBO9185576.1 NAD(P)-dependent oxidoreductase [Rhizobium sp. E27B/91]QXZ82331.1 NAD(P)-dependent oxidoreductase [Rhizobium sp. K1/93]
MKVLVSGGTGLVGRYIVEDLLSHGYSVAVGGRHQPEPGLFSKPVSFVPLRLDPNADQGHAFDDAYFFVHAGFHHVADRYRGGEGDDPAAFQRLNLDGSVKLFETAQRAGIRRCVFLSTRAVYGDRSSSEVLFETSEANPNTLYGRVKLDAERALSAINAPGFGAASLRLTGVYGDLRPNKWTDIFGNYLAGKPVPSRAGTEVHGRDVGQAVRLMLETDTARIANEVFNVSDVLTETHEILAILQRVTGSPHPLPARAPGNIISKMDTSKIAALGWRGGGRALLEKTVASLAQGLPHATEAVPATVSKRG